VTVAPFAKPVPRIVTGVPPSVEPEAGKIEVTAGGVPAMYSKAFESVPVCPSTFATSTLTRPAECAGDVAGKTPAFTNDTSIAGLPPNFTVAPSANDPPVMVTAVPPRLEPDTGIIAFVWGAAAAI